MLEHIKAFIESTAGAIAVLFLGLCLSAAACIEIAITLPANEHLTVLFTGLVSGFSASLFTVITVHAKNNTDITGAGSKVTVNNQEAKSPELPKQ